MQNSMAQHPDRADLEAYGLGLQSSPAADAIERHLSVCEPCGRVLELVRDDWLINLLRSSTVAEAPATMPSPSAMQTASAPGTIPSAKPAIPAELVGHARYRILERLGAGGMGVVYKAEHRLLNQVVALKVVHRHLLDEPKTVARFQQEMKTVAGLSHPNIVRARDAEETAGLHYLVLDYVEGITLAQLVRTQGPLPMVAACDYVRQAALGLQHAFERGVVHRDLKPQNLLVTGAQRSQPVGVVLILDFGLARFVHEGDHGLTHSGVMMGTPDFVAPEQATDARAADIRADIYSLGCTLYFLLAGRPPFPEGTSVEKVLAHLRQRPRSLRELRPDLPVGLVRVVERMMAREPAQRYQTPAEVAAGLTPFVEAVPSLEVPRRLQPRRRWPLVAAVAAAAVIGVVGLILALLPGDRPDDKVEARGKGTDPEPKPAKKEDPPADGKKAPDGKTGGGLGMLSRT
jgi:serine/threonine protein kinase